MASTPACRPPAGRKHGHYEHTVADPLWQGRPVHLRLRLQCFRCSNPACARRSFSESVDEVAGRRAGRSQRLREIQRRPGSALCGPRAAAARMPLARFAAGLRHEAEALRGAITTPWSTSPVEDQIGRLRMLKRTMFSRAGFVLLRQRVLAAT